MLLSKLGIDLTRLNDEEVQEQIVDRTSGRDRTTAILETLQILRRYKQIKWVRNLLCESRSKDIVIATGEWSSMVDQDGKPVTFYRFGGTGCELDGQRLTRIHYLDNSKTGRRLKLGGICSDKVLTGNVFGEGRYSLGDSEDRTLDERVIDGRDILNWITSGDVKNIPKEIISIADKMLQDEIDITQRERDIMVDYYERNRLFNLTELVGADRLPYITAVVAAIPHGLDRKLSGSLLRGEKTTISTARAIVNFAYSSLNEGLGELLVNNDRARRAIGIKAAENRIANPEIGEMCKRILEYVQDYESVNLNAKHGLSGIIFPINLFLGGFFLTAETMQEIEKTHGRIKNLTIQDLEDRRDKNLSRIRKRKWNSNENSRTDKIERVNQFYELVASDFDNSGLPNEIWRLVNGVVKSTVIGARNGYITKEALQARYNGMPISNLRDFLNAGYLGHEFPYSDKVFYRLGESVQNNFPETFMGVYSAYEIPQKIKEITIADANKIRGKVKTQVLNERAQALTAIREIVMERVRRVE